MKQMKLKVLFLIVTLSFISLTVHAQRGVRIGYIDTEYILQNVPDYSESTLQLENKVQQWKSEIEEQLNALELKRTALNNEKALLTKELIEEREEDLDFEEKEILDYQKKRFGTNGDLMLQKKQLMQPIQDQIFQAVQDIAKAKKYDFVFDKSADVVMLYSAERFDISEQVLRTITRASKREQLKSKADKKEVENEEVFVEVNEGKDERELALEAKKEARRKLIEERRKEAEDRRAQILAEREKARQDKIDARNKDNKTDDSSTAEDGEDAEKSTSENQDDQKTREQILEERRAKKLADREARKKELEEKKRQAIEDRKNNKEEDNKDDN
ncbi:OmpH family outer membrane protein [Bizionia paragorgiae]|uniref:Periplasmic chaperone for outer membrane proteins Skp n=1 Tax=Bizionia paragorgiae TaxID=283786 RepID=A0A1H4CWL9_BIZPA|nr:OmpH family outer membrane protein [Bizionia paragorgiae]SEA64492.1 periplasmic chaperone for outer membrane proteins Skp [Bizionia paragorgiae]